MPSFGSMGGGRRGRVSTLLNNSVSVELREEKEAGAAWAGASEEGQEALGSKAPTWGCSPLPPAELCLWEGGRSLGGPWNPGTDGSALARLPH